jgi:hypothetical protein
MNQSLRLTLSAVLVAAGLIAALPTYAGPEDGTKAQVPANTSEGRDRSRGEHIEGHIGFLHAELGITPAQEGVWQPVAAAMRADVTDYKNLAASYPEQYSSVPSAVDSLHERAAFVELHAKAERRFVTAFEPLYNALSADQKAKADQLFANYDNND